MKIINTFLTPAIVYSNAGTDKLQILSETKGKVGIYMFKHLESEKIYIGSAISLSRRLSKYYSIAFLNRYKNMYINNALLHHGYSAFSLSILEFIDITNLSKEDARKFILERENHYLKQIFEVDNPNTYNILKTAGSLLGFNHTAETIVKLSFANKGKILTAETKARMSLAKSGKTLTTETKAKISSIHMGKTFSAETKRKMSAAKLSVKHPFFGKTHSAETKIKMSKKVFVYYNATESMTLLHEFDSCSDAAKFFNCITRTISNYLDKNKLYKKQWLLSSTLMTRDK